MKSDATLPIAIPRRLKRILLPLHFAMTLLGIFTVALIIRSYLSGGYALRINYPQLQAAHHIETELSAFYREAGARDNGQTVSEARLDRCLRIIDTLEQAGFLKKKTAHGITLTFPRNFSKEEQEVRDAIHALKKASRQYHNASFFSSNEAEQKYLAAYNWAVQSSLAYQQALDQAITQSYAKSNRLFHLILFCLIFIVLIIMFALAFFNRQRKLNVQAIDAARQQISAGEQQLMASNQQLRATNQQLMESELKLRESESQFRLLTEQSLLGVMVIQDDLLKYANQGLANIAEFTVEEMLKWPARDFAKIIHPDDRPRIMDYSDRKQTGDPGVPLSNTLRVVTRSGRVKWVDSYSRPVLFQGRVAVINTVADITDRMQKSEEIERLNRELDEGIKRRTQQLETANRELESFSYSVSHDLRAPLRSINGFSQALLEDCGDRLTEAGRDYIRRLQTASGHMGHLINDFLKLSRITRSDMLFESMDLSAMARNVAAELKKDMAGRDVRFIIADNVQVTGDKSMLRTALENLFQNACKYTSKHASARIEFGVMDKEGARACFVRDDGAGFDMAYAGKLFGPFQRFHTAGEFEGTGIGLATVQRIIHRHGGRIWAESEIEKGATFFFIL
ncbi:MAG: ATP-binding protein [Fibrobacterota bacterium]